MLFRSELETYVPIYDEAIKKVGAKTVLFMTAGVFTDYPDRTRTWNEMQIGIGRRRGMPVAPGGLTWIRFLGEKPSEAQILDLYAKDKSHPNGKGTYLNACLLYATLTGKSPVGLVSDIAPLPLDYVYGKRLTLAPEEAARMQKAAWEVHRESATN